MAEPRQGRVWREADSETKWGKVHATQPTVETAAGGQPHDGLSHNFHTPFALSGVHDDDPLPPLSVVT